MQYAISPRKLTIFCQQQPSQLRTNVQPLASSTEVYQQSYIDAIRAFLAHNK
ncbi:hypothetical protein [Sodalis-like endosymbiont of Proechinophthirus fluctus]|uniref:hypothetical protein n=1 Tax=Sodalis-like endosymbiont of Proechinophthirus fluctus TaxID=1462730 RepID=UPI001FCBDA01|nr:hypothetical protein [Sodalis-like endosymbiont of Proechinophthirus fluctus]